MGRIDWINVMAVIALGAGYACAQTSAPEIQALQAQIQQLQAQVDELKNQQAQVLNTADVDLTVDQVMRDAAARSQLLQVQGFTAGWNNERFVVQSDDGNYSLRPGLQLQFRHVINSRDTDHGQETDHGFEMKRVKFSIDGNFMSKRLTYFFLWSSQTNGGNLFLEHAWVKYALNDNWAVRGGQMGNPVFKEQSTSSRRSLAVDRSLANVVVTGSNEAQLQAVTLAYQDNPFYIEGGYGDGFVSADTDWATPGNWNVFVRADYVLDGSIKQASEFTARGNRDPLMVVGGGLDITDGPDAVYYRHTADVQYKDAGQWGLFAAYIGNYRKLYGGGNDYDLGFMVQAAYAINDQWELFGRYGVSILDQAVTFASGSEDTFHELTFGANRYFFGHSAKFSIDLTCLPNGSPSDQKGLGFYQGDDVQFVVRSQFQLLL